MRLERHKRRCLYTIVQYGTVRLYPPATTSTSGPRCTLSHALLVRIEVAHARYCTIRQTWSLYNTRRVILAEPARRLPARNLKARRETKRGAHRPVDPHPRVNGQQSRLNSITAEIMPRAAQRVLLHQRRLLPSSMHGVLYSNTGTWSSFILALHQAAHEGQDDREEPTDSCEPCSKDPLLHAAVSASIVSNVTASAPAVALRVNLFRITRIPSPHFFSLEVHT